MKIGEILKKECVLAQIKSKTKREVIRELLEVLEKAGLIKDIKEAERVILERERLGSTGIGDGIAIPHGKMRNIDGVYLVFGRSKEGIDFDAIDKKPVHLFFLLLAPEDSMTLHLKMLSRISRLLRDTSFRKRLIELETEESIYRAILEEEERLF